VPATVLVPVNSLERAKGRLATLLTQEERTALALATLNTVLDGLKGWDAVVLTADPHVRAAVGGRARVMDESSDTTGLNGQLEFALGELAAHRSGLGEVIILHADLPLFVTEALGSLQEAAGAAPAVALARAPDGGTNAMLLRPPGRFPLCYGVDSAARHVAAAKSASFDVVLIDSPALALDLDTPDDIRALLATPHGRESRAGVLLLALGIDDRLDRGRETGGALYP
jgi:2-phospho-L-lactate/phosphoenolpyruvate guanylyltransferase